MSKSGALEEDILHVSVDDLVTAYRRKSLSPREVAESVLDRIEQLNPIVNAFCLVDREATLSEATQSEKRWAAGSPRGCLDGVPTSIKDILLTAGWPTLRGSLAISEDGDWDEDAPAVARLREAGAVIVGKTTSSEFGWKGVTDSPRHGITRNPWATDRTPGGSSGGAAVAAALGMGVLHLGTDAGGSIRIPAGFTGVFGHKPTYGRVPAYPLSPFGTIAHIGPITQRVEDAAWMMNEITRPDPRDWAALPDSRCDYRQELLKGVAGLRVAYSPSLGHAGVDREIAGLVGRAAAEFESLGAEVDEVGRIFDDPLETISILWKVGAARLGAGLSAEQRTRLDPNLREMMGQAVEVSLDSYLDAMAARERLGRTMNHFHTTYDLLLTPALPIPAFAAGELVPDASYGGWLEWAPFSYPFNLTQQPACSVPCGLTQGGLPAGLQIVAGRHRDDLALRAAAAYEAANPTPRLSAPVVIERI